MSHTLHRPQTIKEDGSGSASGGLSPAIRYALLAVIVVVAAFLRFVRIASLPPAAGYDPAYYGVDALHILEGHLPIFLPSNIGREPLFSYLVALAVATFGIGDYAIHIASAAVGLAAVPAVYFFATTVFADEDPALRTGGGLLAAAMMATSYWHVNWSRYGVRAIMVPLFVALTLGALLQALRAGSRAGFSIAGMLLGLSTYTYQSARLLPLLVITVFGLEAWRRHAGNGQAPAARKASPRGLWEAFAIVTLTALLIFAPMGLYFVAHPGSGMERVDDVFIYDPTFSMRDNIKRVWYEIDDALNVFFVHGDEEPIHNLEGRPALNPFFATLFCVGLIISLIRLRRPGYLLLLLSLPVMSLTVVLSLGGQPTKRALGALPAVAAIIAIGTLVPWWALHRWAKQRSRPTRLVSWALLGALVAGYVGSAVWTYRDYVLIWGRDPDLLFTHFEGTRSAIGQFVRSLPEAERVYISPELPEHPSIIFNSGARRDLRGYNGRVCTVLPVHTQESITYVIVQEQDGNSLGLLRDTFPQGEIVAEGPLQYQQPCFLAYRVPPGVEANVRPAHPHAATWERRIALLGYDLDRDAYLPGDTVNLALYLQGLDKMELGYVLFVHLLGPPHPEDGGPLWAQDDSEPCRTFYPTWRWDVGEIVRDTYRLTVPDFAPPGVYDLQMGFYHWPDMVHLTVDGTEDPSITSVFGRITILAPDDD